jgi:predicted kinase
MLTAVRTLFLIRGLPGSGKTRTAGLLRSDAKYVGPKDFSDEDSFERTFHPVLEADAYFTTGDGVYHFDASKLAEAHAWCQDKTREALRDSWENPAVFVTNTFSCRWEMEPYFRMAKDVGARVVVLDLFDGGLSDEELFERGTHDVPLHTIKAMRLRWEHSWRDGNPVAPWERSANTTTLNS